MPGRSGRLACIVARGGLEEIAQPGAGLGLAATFDLTVLAPLRHWSWPVALVDIGWGAVVTAVSSTAGLLVAERANR
ncbi:DUF2177 family protein [Bradyrhizobium sp. CB82]|uniref:DUF2177 family protein n=1 Tax=Bradyrhizobium sp. CB82 TaxID=3039159 RepID=UPI0024B1B5A5|nr:DUF2177 family protein [Bradyrhizobium sp. CB82]WFU38046.1 DUF2177 family protein [Bradyrhizobium sp. CB82]